MTKNEYLETIYINGIKVDIGLDDYGQCYFYEYTDINGATISCGCGTYNTQYLETIYADLDPIYHELEKKDLFGELTEDEQAHLQKYNDMFQAKYKEEYNG